MDYLSAAALGGALAMDACAVSMTCGLKSRSSNQKMGLTAAFLFGLFQTLMPLLGWSIGKVESHVFDAFDHIIAFLILLIIGAKMLWDSRKTTEEIGDTVTLKELLLLAVATSMDAMASGIAIPVTVGADTVQKMLSAVGMIGGITFLMSLGGYGLGKMLGSSAPKYAGIVGGVVLILIAMKTLVSG